MNFPSLSALRLPKHLSLPLRIALVALGVLILIPLLLPLFVSTKSFKPLLEQQLTSALGRQVSFGDLSLHPLSGSLVAQDLAVADDPHFSSEPFVTAKSIKIGVKLWPLILSHRLGVTSLTIEKPQIRLVKNAKDEWNFASFASNSASSPSTSSTSASSVPDLVVGKFAIVDGELTVASATTGRQSNYTKVEVKAQELSLNNQFPLQVSITLPGNGSMSLDGKIGPVAQGNATETPLDLNLKVNDFDLSKSGFLDPRAGIRGITNLEAALHASTGKARLNGTVKLAKLQIFRGGAPAGVPITVDFDVDYDLKSSSGTLNRGTVHVGKAQTQLQGSFQQKGPAELVDLTVKGAAMPVSDLQAALPAAGVILPKGSELQDGTANLNLHAVGPADKIVITGSTGLDNAKLAGFDLGSSFAAVSKITGGNLSSPDTVIQHFTTNVRVAPEGIAANNILANIQHLGDVTGNGTLNAANELDFKMDMKIGGKIGVPFTVTGNSSKPKITPDFSSMLKGSLGGAKALTSSAGSGLKKGVGGLFKKK